MTTKKQPELSMSATVAEIFSHPLPQVRLVHRGLTNELDEKRAQLRTLVGGSYRQLLGTADNILLMNEVIRKAEDDLARVSHSCRKTAIDSLAKGLSRIHKYEKTGLRREQLQRNARLKALDLQSLFIGRLLRKKTTCENNQTRGETLILAVKILAVSMSLVNSIEELENGKMPDCRRDVLEIKRKLDISRTKLMGMIERILRKGSGDDREEIIEALIAYCFITNSGIIDALKYFLRLREVAIAESFAGSSQISSNGVVRVLLLFLRTLFDTQKIFPRRLSEKLMNIKIESLLKDRSIRDIEELRLDELENWFDEVPVTLTPNFNYNDLDRPHTNLLLKEWSMNVSKALIKRFSQILGHQTDLKSIVNLRTTVFDVWMKEGAKANGFNPTLILKGLREATNSRMLEIIQQNYEALSLVGTEIKSTVASWESGITDKELSLWDQSVRGIELNNGADLFKKSIIARTYGRNDTVLRALKCYQTWYRPIHEALHIIEQLKTQKWELEFEDTADDDIGSNTRSDTLHIEDPELLKQYLESGLKRSFNEMQEEIEHLLMSNENSTHIGQISIYILRVIRDIRSELPQDESIQNFGISLFDYLYDKLTRTILGEYLTQFLQIFEKKTVTGRSLWEGDPKLPAQPSPAAFKLIYNISLAMGRAGQDLWNCRAVFILKKVVSTELASKWIDVIKKESIANQSKDEKDDVNKNEKRKEAMIQAYIDFSFILKNAFRNRDSAVLLLVNDLETLIRSQVEFDTVTQERISNCTEKYWKKTSLLFGILA
ncbi:putative sphingolipid c9-methyltransferase [Golovinomyces cichoracearum]|uniref:Conserved oligomeric Golgi complex subunit 1 n=1 Tax=Golovinomyces cichoracearum TaxID=62708 RepID=A0A420HEU9_9PEZI|nr:putative sphingolipid c9-methyltransferase [Golovinomyces cichoracearum]